MCSDILIFSNSKVFRSEGFPRVEVASRYVEQELLSMWNKLRLGKSSINTFIL
jgi:hypothetical protein